MSIIAKNITIKRGQRAVISNLSFECSPSSITMLLGPNGSGKTTLLRMIAGLIPLMDGQLIIMGDEKNTMFDKTQLALSYLGHLNALKPQQTVQANLDFWARLTGSDHSSSLIDKFSIEPLLELPVSNCSAGQQRRVALVRSLNPNKKIWLLDEPTNALDQNNIQILADHLTAHKSRGGTIIIATHQPLPLKDVQTITLIPPKPQKIKLSDSQWDLL